MDVKTSFLNGEVEEEVCIQQPNGFVVHGNESHVCKLKKSLYSRIDSYLRSLGFSKSEVDHNMYFKVVKK